MPADLVMDLSPTQKEFVNTSANIAQLLGPMGEGKTHAGVAGVIRHARRCAPGLNGQSLRGALIRDTHQNIKISTVESITEILGDWVFFKDDYKKMFIRTTPQIEFDLFGIDDPASISKLQGPGYGIIWLEEPAPIIERKNAGLPKDVFLMAIARCGRQKGSIPRLQITQNSADELHWTTELIDAPYEYCTLDGAVVTKLTFRIPKGENKHLTALQRALNTAAFQSDKGMLARYVEGEEASVEEGSPVCANYGPATHFSQKILPVYPNLPSFRGWDGYGHPACVTAQWNPFGQLVVHDVLYEEGSGTEDLIENKLQPLLATPKYAGKFLPWRDIGDPTMKAPDQSSAKRSAAKVIQTMLDTRFESGPTRWPNRIDPLNHAFGRSVIGGRPLIVLSASAAPLNRALKGGWHYRTDNSGHVVGKLPVDNQHAHPGNAFAYLVSVLLPYNRQKKPPALNRERDMARIASYATGGGRRASAGGLL
jgi:hypothetical protein